MASSAIYHVRMLKVGGWAVENNLTGDQSNESAKIDNKPGSDYKDRGIGRLKTATGEASAIIRNSQGVEFTVHATPGSPGEHRFPNGEVYRLEVTEVRGPEKPVKVNLDTIAVRPPRFTIERKREGLQDGVLVTFQPTGLPAIFTVAPEGAAKPLGLPSLPFPQVFPDGIARSQVSLFIPILDVEPPTQHGEGTPFLLKEHTHVRIGVRGAGLFVRSIPVPAPGAAPHVVEPKHFMYLASAMDAKWLDADAIALKYSEKASVLRYS